MRITPIINTDVTARAVQNILYIISWSHIVAMKPQALIAHNIIVVARSFSYSDIMFIPYPCKIIALSILGTIDGVNPNFKYGWEMGLQTVSNSVK